MAGFEVWTDALRSAGDGWREQHEALRTARSALVGAESGASATGARVQPSVDAFLDVWIEQLRTHAATAEGNADSLELAAGNYDTADADSAAELAGLLPWDQRQLRPPGHPR